MTRPVHVWRIDDTVYPHVAIRARRIERVNRQLVVEMPDGTIRTTLADAWSRTRKDAMMRYALVTDNIPLAIHWAGQRWAQLTRQGLAVSRSDLDQAAMIALIRAARLFKSKMGFTFGTYASVSIKRELNRWWDTEPIIHIPEGQLQAAKDRTAFPVAKCGDDWSLHQVRNRMDDVEQYHRVDDADEVENGLSVLSDRERFVVVNRFGIGGCVPKTLDEVGAVLRLTRERVRQIESIALDKMRARMGAMGGGGVVNMDGG